MEFAETDQPDFPAGPIALATALSGVPVTLLFAAFFQPWLMPGDPRDIVQWSALLIFAGMGPSCLIGVPIAVVALRNRNILPVAWAVAGAVTALAAVVVVGFWNLGIAFPMFFFSFMGGISLVGAMLGALSGLVARLLLAVILGMSRR